MAQMEEVTESMALVRIKTEVFSVLEIPSPECMLVKEYTDAMSQNDELAKFVDTIGSVGNFVWLAYNGVAAAGYTDLKIKVHRIAYDITKLCNKSALTVSKFKRASNNILTDLQGTHQFLLDQREDMAVETLTAVTGVAKEMADAAEQLAKEFEKQGDQIQSTYEDIMKTKGDDDDNRKKLAKWTEDLKQKKAQFEKKLQEREKELKEYEKRYEEAREKQKFAEASTRSPWKQMINAFYSAAKAPFPNMGVAEKYRNEAESHFEDLKEQREARLKVLGDIAELAKSIENCTSDEKLADVAVDALHEAVGCLGQLSTLMMKVSEYWEGMSSSCEDSALRMDRIARNAKTKPSTELLKDTRSMEDAIRLYCQWVAIGLTCSIHMDKIKETQKSLYAHLEENPTTEEAQRNVRRLALECRQDVEAKRCANK